VGTQTDSRNFSSETNTQCALKHTIPLKGRLQTSSSLRYFIKFRYFFVQPQESYRFQIWYICS